MESSLRLMGTDRLDALLIHWPICLDRANADHQAARLGAWRAMEQLVHDGWGLALGWITQTLCGQQQVQA